MTIHLKVYKKNEQLPELPGNNMFHSNTLFNIYASTPGFRPIMIVASDDNNLLLGKLLGVIRCEHKWYLPFFYHRCVVYGTGEYFNSCDEDVVFQSLLEKFTHIVRRKAMFIEFRNLDNALFGYKAFRLNGYYACNWLRVINDLKTEKNIHSLMSASRLKEIKRGLDNGAIVREANSPEEVKEFAKLIQKFCTAKVRRYIPNLIFFEHLEEHILKEGHKGIFVVIYEGVIIGGAACFYSQSTAYIWFTGGMNKKYPKQYPGILAVDYALKYAQQAGYDDAEFMDVGLPYKKHGYRSFVLRFGGRQVSTRRWHRISWKWLNSIFRFFYR